MLSAAAWSRLDVLLDAASALDPEDRAAWLDAQRLRPELRAYLAARLAMGPDALDESPPMAAGTAGSGSLYHAPRPPAHRARPAAPAHRLGGGVGRGRLRGAAVWLSAAALVALGTTYLARPRAQLAH